MKLRIWAAGLILASSSATASVLTKDNAPLLCPPPGSGTRVVDPDRLAHFIVSQAGAGLFLDGSNSTGQRDGVIQLNSSATSASEPVYAIRESGRANVSVERPFGPDIDLGANPAAKQARDKIVAELVTLIPLMDSGRIVDGPVEYKLERQTGVGIPTSSLDAKNPLLLFAANSPFSITCHDSPASQVAGTGSGSLEVPKPAPTDLQTRVVLRGAVKDLAIAPGDLKDATPASIRFDRDKVADTRAFKIDGILGLHISRAIGDIEIIPYAAYELTAAKGSDNDVEKLSPGLLLAHRIETPSFALHSKLEASLIYDLEQRSRQGKLRIYFDPAFALGGGRGVLFGSYLRPIGPLWIRPDLTLIVDATKVFRSGTSEELAAVDSYFGVGGELSLRSRLELGRPISDLSFKVGVRDLLMSGEIKEKHIRRFFGSVEYAPKDFPYVGVAFEFNSGENDDTFQEERTYGIGVTLRY